LRNFLRMRLMLVIASAIGEINSSKNVKEIVYEFLELWIAECRCSSAVIEMDAFV